MKKLPGIFLFALVIALPGWTRGPSPLPSVLRIGVYDNPPKIGISSSRQPYGFHIDVLNALLEGTGIKPEYVIGTWEENLGRLERGEIDMMPDVAYSPGRAKAFDFNNESVLLNWAVVYTAASESLNTIADLDGKRVAVMKDSIHTIGEHGIIGMASDFGIKCRFIYFDSYEETFKAIRQGRADAAVVNRLFGLMNENDDSLVRTSIVFNPSQLKYAFRKSSPANPSLIELFDSRLVRLKERKDSAYYKAFAKYLLLQISKEGRSPEWLGNVVLLAIAIALIMTLFLLSARSGKSENMQMKRFFRENKSMGDIRVSIVDRALVSYSLFSIPLLLSILYHCIVARWDPNIWLYIPTLLLPAIAAMFRKRLSALSKVGIILFFMFIMGVLVFISNGNVGIGFTYFLTAGIVTSLVYGKRAGLAALIAGLVITIGFGILVQDKVIRYEQEMASYFISPSSWIFAVMSFSMMFFTIIGGIEKFYGNLIEAVEHLEQRIDERTKDIDTANKNLQIEILEHRKAEEMLEAARHEAEQANSAKSTFFAGMSHEIRTPLNAILGYSQILLGDKSLSGESKREIETINSSGEHLLGLINQVLEMSKIEAGKTEVYLEPCNVSSVLRHVENMFAITAGKKNIAFSVHIPADLPECVATDESKLKQI
ncbi:MAG TPA: transporter substrate-binding domain-containing protein, partial [Rectinemataceae bacterium]|nr:transporter substrate-binding domain-containing protein [Rectinemataceae bacterium]